MWEGIIAPDTRRMVRKWIDDYCENEDTQDDDWFRVDALENLTESAYRLGFGHGVTEGLRVSHPVSTSIDSRSMNGGNNANTETS